MEVTLRKMWLQDGPPSYKSTYGSLKMALQMGKCFFSPLSFHPTKKTGDFGHIFFVGLSSIRLCINRIEHELYWLLPQAVFDPDEKKTHCVEELESQLIDSWKTKLGDPEQHLECKNTIISIFGLNNILQKMGKPKISNFLKTCKTTSFPYGILSFGLSLFLSGFEGQLDSDHPQPPKDPKWTPSYINRLVGSL